MAYQFATLDDVQRIARSVLVTEGRRLNVPKLRGRWHMPAGGGVRIGKTDEAITARVTTTPGTGTVSLYNMVGTTLTDTGENVEAYNLSATAVASGAYVGIIYAAGVWWVMWEDCT